MQISKLLKFCPKTLALLLYQVYFKFFNPQSLYVMTNFVLWFINVSFLLIVQGVVQKHFGNVKLFCVLS